MDKAVVEFFKQCRPLSRLLYRGKLVGYTGMDSRNKTILFTKQSGYPAHNVIDMATGYRDKDGVPIFQQDEVEFFDGRNHLRRCRVDWDDKGRMVYYSVDTGVVFGFLDVLSTKKVTIVGRSTNVKGTVVKT